MATDDRRLGPRRTRLALSIPSLVAATGTAAFALIMARAAGPFAITPDEPAYASASTGLLLAFIVVVCAPALAVYLIAAGAVIAGSVRRWLWVALCAASLLLAAAQLWGLPGALERFPGTLWLVALPVVSLYLAALSLFAALPGGRLHAPTVEQ